MEVLCTIAEIGELRTFNGKDGAVEACDVILKSGGDGIQASCFDKMARMVKSDNFPKEALYKAALALSVGKTEKGSFQRVRCEHLDLVFDLTKTF